VGVDWFAAAAQVTTFPGRQKSISIAIAASVNKEFASAFSLVVVKSRHEPCARAGHLRLQTPRWYVVPDSRHCEQDGQ